MWNLSAITFVDANCTATILAADVKDSGYNSLDGNRDGVGGDNYAFDFFHLFGDLDGSGLVNFVDYAIFAEKWQSTGCTQPYYCDGADNEPDGDIDLTDLARFCDNWLQGVP